MQDNRGDKGIRKRKERSRVRENELKREIKRGEAERNNYGKKEGRKERGIEEKMNSAQ
jgi:hypothetical protein